MGSRERNQDGVSQANHRRHARTKLLIRHTEVHDAIFADVVEQKAVVDICALLVLVGDAVQNVLRMYKRACVCGWGELVFVHVCMCVCGLCV